MPAEINITGNTITTRIPTILLAELNCSKILLVKNKLKKKSPITLASKKD
jgi:hypothetical protein